MQLSLPRAGLVVLQRRALHQEEALGAGGMLATIDTPDLKLVARRDVVPPPDLGGQYKQSLS